MGNIFSNIYKAIYHIFNNTRGEIKSPTVENEPDKRRTYVFDGVKITANLFFQKTGKAADETVEDFLIKSSIKQLVKKH